MEQDLEAAEGLVDWYRSMKWIEETERAEAVIRKNPLCKGCWDTTEDCFFRCGNNSECAIRTCCIEKQLNHCGDCIDFPCVKYMEFVGDLDHHKKAMEYLILLKNT